MSALLHQLANNEAVLLMYLFDELDADVRAEVDALLATDQNLRAQLATLTKAHALIQHELVADDAEQPHLATQSCARRAIRTVRRLAPDADQAPVHRPVTPSLRLTYPWWAYPASAAAAILLAFLVWWGNTPGNIMPFDQGVLVQSPEEADPLVMQTAQSLRESFDDSLSPSMSMEDLDLIEAQMTGLQVASTPGSELWLDLNTQ